MSERSAGMHNGNSDSHLVPLGLRELLDASPDVIFACDSDGALLWLSRAFEPLTDRRTAEQIGRHWSTLVAPQEHRRLLRTFLRQRRRHTGVVEATLPLLASQGREVWVAARVGLHERPDGGIIFVGSARMLGPDEGRVAVATLGTATAAEPAPAPGSGRASSTDSAAAPSPAERRGRGGLAAALSFLTRGKGAGVPASPTAAPASPPTGTSPAAAEPERLEQLRSELEEAQALARSKTEFLATMTHEIRTPMNGMLGMAHLLLETDLDGEQRGMVEVLLHSGQVLLDLVNDTLDFSRVEAGKLELENIPFDLRVATNEIATLLAPVANEKGLHLDCQVHHEVPSRVKGDPGRLRQVLLNLGGNAVKFTEQGSVTLSVGRLREDESTVTLRWTVADTGIGMSDEQRSRLFQAFTQGDISISRRYGGTGLGLAISSRLVALMGGTMGLDSEPGQGSRFWFDVTLEKQGEMAAPAPSPSRAELAGLRVLAVDPSAAMRRSIAAKLEAWGCRVEAAEDGEQALETLHAAVQAGDPFRFALIERELPGMNGEELGAAIRADGAHDGTLTALVTAVGRRGDAARARARGFTAYLMKPLDWEELATALAEMLHVASTTPAGETPPLVTRHSLAEARRSRMRVLLVEDSAVNQLVAEWTLRRLGYGLRTVGTVQAALAAWEQEPFDLVLLDLALPDGNGLELAQQLRAREAPGRHVPIVAMTGSTEIGDREKCLTAGMDEYLPKPVDLGLMCRVVERLTVGASLHEDGIEGENPGGEETGGGPGARAALEPDPSRIAVVVDDAPLLRAVEAAEAEVDGVRVRESSLPEAAGEGVAAELGQAPEGFESTNAAAILAARAAAPVGEDAPPRENAAPQAAEAPPAEAQPSPAPEAPPAPAIEPLSLADVTPLGPSPAESAPESPPALDLARLEQTCMGIPALRETVINAFLTEVRPRLENLGRAVNARDAHRVEFEAHGLKGMCGTLGALACAEVFTELERLGRADTLDGATRVLKRAYLEVTRAEQFLATQDRERKAA